jgi:BirA family transcriptional regulator, biotin operon repressor / biotin---[acetyl-CoA-carboxylase] ligase
MVTGMSGGDARPGLSAGQEQALRGSRFGVRWVAETGSTNDDLLAAVDHGAADGAVLVADHQTSGHGRRGRSWEAPPGSSLLVSILLRPDVDPDRLHLLTTAVGVATAEAVDEEVSVPVGLKWPNDLVVETPAGERKLGGILAEAAWSGPRLDAVVIGLGLNVAWPQAVPEELEGIAVALNHLTDEPLDRGDLLVSLLLRLEAILADPAGAGLLDRWRFLARTLDQEVRIELASGDVVTGRAVDLSDTGRLVVETSAGREEITAGDVHHLRT